MQDSSVSQMSGYNLAVKLIRSEDSKLSRSDGAGQDRLHDSSPSTRVSGGSQSCNGKVDDENDTGFDEQSRNSNVEGTRSALDSSGHQGGAKKG